MPEVRTAEVLQLQEVENPAPKKKEIRIKIHATTVTSSDCIVRGFNIHIWQPVGFMMGLVMGFGKPRKPILGMVAAGEVDAAGKDAARFKMGDRVLAHTVQSLTKTWFSTYRQSRCLNRVEPTFATQPNVRRIEKSL